MSLRMTAASLIVFCCIVFFPKLISAQDVGAAKVYKKQFMELHSKVKAILMRVEEQRERRETLTLREEVFALTKLVHSLGEQAAQSNVDSMKQGSESNKSLLLVDSGCEQMSFVLGTLDSFLKTGDRAFLGFAKKGDELTSSLEAIL